MKHGVVPKHSFLQELSSCATATVPEKFYDRVEEGSILLKKAGDFSFCEKGILVGNEIEPLKTDLVIFATGYWSDKKLKDIFLSHTYQDYMIGSPDKALPLFRLVVHIYGN